MKKPFKIWISILAICVLLTQILPVTVFADPAGPTITVGSAQGAQGEPVDVIIQLDVNPGIASANISIGFDADVLTLTDVADGGLLGTAWHSDDLTSPYVLSWVNDLAPENIVANGTIVTLTFAVAASAPLGDTPITVSYRNGDIANVDLEPVAFATVNGKVTVVASAYAEVIALIAALPSPVTPEAAAQVAAARTAYDALTEDDQDKVDNYSVLQAAEATLQDYADAAAVDELIEKLPSADELALTDKSDVDAARAAYDALNDNAKSKVTKLDDLMAVEEVMEELIAADNIITEAARAMEVTIVALPDEDALTPDDAKAVQDARAAYDALSDEAKERVPDEVVEKLEALEKKLESLMTKQYLMGDMNFDEKVDARDALLALKVSVNKIVPTALEKLVGDMNHDQTITACDALQMLKTAVGKKDYVYIMA